MFQREITMLIYNILESLDAIFYWYFVIENVQVDGWRKLEYKIYRLYFLPHYNNQLAKFVR